MRQGDTKTKFRAGDILKVKLTVAQWKKKYPSDDYEEFWHYYRNGTIDVADYAFDPSYCGGTELKGWDRNDFEPINRVCIACHGRGRIGKRLEICGQSL